MKFLLKARKVITQAIIVVLMMNLIIIYKPVYAANIIPKKITLNIGDKKALIDKNISKEPLSKATWKSSNKKVATVNQSGVLTAKSEGSATITTQLQKKSYTCKVIVKKNITSENSKYIKKISDEKRVSVLNQTTEITKSDQWIKGETYTGNAYYVSPNGNDDNDGLSPLQAWRTVGAVNGADLKAGDAVFFERGGIWRSTEALNCAKGVTYSAYGTGDKPLFTQSPENGSGVVKWSLFAQDKTGKKIWKFYRPMTETGRVVFNYGEGYAPRIYEWWTGKEYESLDITWKKDEMIGGIYDMKSKGKLYSIPQALKSDLTMLIRIDYTGCKYPIWPIELMRKGDLYLRCDKGNPGEIYDSIEFETYGDNPSRCIFATDDCVIDNLAVKYFAMSGIQSMDYEGEKEYHLIDGAVVQNCEVAWAGTTIHEYISKKPTIDYMLSGDGIYGLCNNALIRNNYCHDLGAAGITFEIPKEYKVKAGDYICKDNLIENCAQSIWLHDDFKNLSMNKILVEGNIINNTGYGGSSYGCFCEYTAIRVACSIMNMKSAVVRDNIINRSRQYLIQTFSYDRQYWETEDNKGKVVDFLNNTYIQDKDKYLALFPYSYYEKWSMSDKNLIHKLKNILLDKSPRIYWIS